MKTRETLVVIAVILGAALLLVLVPRGAEVGSPAAERTRAEGALAIPPASAPGLRGVVRGEDGRGLAEAEVYLLPKTLGGDVRVEVTATPDAEGRWALPGIVPRGHWIAARAEGAVVAFADGDAWQGGEVVLVPASGRRIEINLEDEDGGVPPGAEVVVAPPPRSGTFPYPAPGRRRAFSLTRSFDGTSPCTVVLPTDGPVVVAPHVPGHVVTPQAVTVQAETPTVAFHASRACTVTVRVVDADSGEALAGPLHIALLDLSTGRAAIAADDPEAFARTAARDGIPPGRYSLLVACEGYRPFADGDIRLDAPGAEAAVEARLTPDPTRRR